MARGGSLNISKGANVGYQSTGPQSTGKTSSAKGPSATGLYKGSMSEVQGALKGMGATGSIQGGSKK
jgi:hypothetical protein